MKGFEFGLTMRAVCSALSRLKPLWTLATTKSKRLENVVGVVEGAIGADVRFNALEDAE